MAVKIVDFMFKKCVYSYDAGYIEAILQTVMAKVMFWNTAQTEVASLKRWDCFDKRTLKIADNMAA